MSKIAHSRTVNKKTIPFASKVQVQWSGKFVEALSVQVVELITAQPQSALLEWRTQPPPQLELGGGPSPILLAVVYFFGT